MKTHFRLFGVCGVLCLLAGTVQAGDTLEEMEKDVTAKYSKIKSMTADVTMTTKNPQMEMEGFGKFEMMKKDGKELSRMEQDINNRMKMGTEWVTMTQKILSISDGVHTLTVTDHMGQKRGMKTNYDPKQQMTGGDAMFAVLKKEGTLKRLADDKLGEHVCYVLEVTPKTPSPQVAKQMLYFRKDIGLPTKIVMINPEGNPLMTIMFKEIKVNETIDAKRFELKAPDGVQVMDMTTPVTQQPSAPTPTPKPAPAPAPAPEKKP